jgi:hypothetical protein
LRKLEYLSTSTIYQEADIMKNRIWRAAAGAASVWFAAAAGAVPTPIVFEAAGGTAAAITPMRDDFRTAIGGGTVAGANGSFGGVRREIN